MTRAELYIPELMSLGERPVWDERTGQLWWVDIDAGTVHRLDSDGTLSSRKYADTVGCLGLREHGGLILGTSGGLMLVDADGDVERTIAVPGVGDGQFFNDGVPDPSGRFLAGTSTADVTPGAATLWRLEPDMSLHAVLTGISESNGLGWSSDGRTMYYADSGTTDLTVHDYDPATGVAGPGRVLIHLDDGGVPDGFALDAEGDIWLAVWGGRSVRHYNPHGVELGRIDVDADHVTCPVFAGPDLDLMVITTAYGYLADADRDRQPSAGALFSARPGVRGRPATRFAG